VTKGDRDGRLARMSSRRRGEEVEGGGADKFVMVMMMMISGEGAVWLLVARFGVV
jgi:hypothetical protein